MSTETVQREAVAPRGTDWFHSTPESERLLSQERLLLEVSELVCSALEHRGSRASDLAEMLDISRSEVSQRLSGRRNLSLRTLADMLHVLGFGIEARLVDRTAESPNFQMETRVMSWPSVAKYRQSSAPLRLINGQGDA